MNILKDSKKQKRLSRDMIKYIAVIVMILNHISFIFLDQNTVLGIVLTDVGFFTGITMIWFLVQGYELTRSRKKYGQRLLIFAVLSQIPYCLAFTKGRILEFYGYSMIFTLFICFLIVHVLRTWQDGWQKFLAASALVAVTFNSDWGLVGPTFAILFCLAGNDRQKQKEAWIKAILFYGFVSLMEMLEKYSAGPAFLHAAGAMIAPVIAGICILYFYDLERKSRHPVFAKWFFYIVYPGHLLLLGILRIAAGI